VGKLTKDVWERVSELKTQTAVKLMIKSFLRSMAPLVAGMLFVAQTGIGLAAYPQISSFEYINSYEVEVTVSTSPYTTFWWFDQNRTQAAQSYDGYDIANTYPGVTNVAVYVYDVYPGGDYTYAIIDDVNGTYIWNGP
jgi:hypothetical protein